MITQGKTREEAVGKFGVFRGLSITARKNADRSKGTIINQDNSGIEGVGEIVLVGDCVGFGEVEVETEPSAMVIVCVLLQSPNCPVKLKKPSPAIGPVVIGSICPIIACTSKSKSLLKGAFSI